MLITTGADPENSLGTAEFVGWGNRVFGVVQLRGVGGMLPRKIFQIFILETVFPAFRELS